ncbi:MAG TPA: PAS domain S-box protein [Candidatus Bathyarchaeia archaeon]|nr:PAS domain S-box protein [Candidatus Bathyarchaeia archaeon]
MSTDRRAQMSRILRGCCVGAAAVAVLTGLGGLVGGWARRAAALDFALCGAALLVLRDPSTVGRLRAAADVAAGLAAVVAAAAWLGRSMAPLTTLCFLLLAAALLSLDRERVFRMGQRLAVTAGFLALVNVAAYGYGARALPSATPVAAEMGPLAAAVLVVLSAGITAARPGRGATGIFVQETAGGMIARRLLPAILVGSVLIGALVLAGERAGYYGLEFGVALVTVAHLSVFSALAWLVAVRLHRIDARRLRAEAELREVNAELEARVAARTTELAASEEQYRRLIEDSVEGIFIHQEGVVRFVNAAGIRMHGYTEASQIVGQPVMAFVAPDHRDAVAARVAGRLRGEDLPSTSDIEALRQDGSRFWAAATASVVEWEGARAILVSFIDISERQRREAAERKAESLRAVTKLANAAAHEINNPLTVVGGNIQLLADRIGDRPDLQRYVERCLRGVKRIAEMITHMTHVTRLTLIGDLDTGGVPTLDLRASSEPGSEGEAVAGDGEPRAR